MRSYYFINATYPIRGFMAFLARHVISLFHKKVILVFGMSRSGTSMLSKFLSLGPSTVSMHEPEVELMKQRFGRKRFFTQQAFWDFVHAEDQKEFKVHSLVCIVLLAALKAPAHVKSIVIKPIALLDVLNESSAALPNASIVYICRHPAGRSESILRQLKHDQNIEEISIEALELIGQDWGRTNLKVKRLFEAHPGWRWVFFEKLTNDPVLEFRGLYDRLGLPWTEAIQSEIEKNTTGMDGGYYDIKRDSRSQADKWRKSLTEEQVEAIRRGCLPFETNLYDSF